MKILVIDDHVLIREALRGALKDFSADAVVLEAKNCGDAVKILDGCGDDDKVDLALLDLVLPDRDGFSFLSELRERWPATSVVVLAAAHDRASITRALDLGASGFIPKTAEREIMLSALRLVGSGGVYVPPEILAGDASPDRQSAPAVRRSAASPMELGLTARQVEVLALMMQGKSNKAISRRLDMAQPTVKNHVTAIFKALNATNRTEAVVIASQLGWQLPAAEGS